MSVLWWYVLLLLPIDDRKCKHEPRVNYHCERFLTQTRFSFLTYPSFFKYIFPVFIFIEGEENLFWLFFSCLLLSYRMNSIRSICWISGTLWQVITLKWTKVLEVEHYCQTNNSDISWEVVKYQTFFVWIHNVKHFNLH